MLPSGGREQNFHVNLDMFLGVMVSQEDQSWGWNPGNSGFTLPCELFFKRTNCPPNTFAQDHLWCGAIQRGLAHAEDRGLGTAGLSLSLGSSLLSYVYEACPPFISSLHFFSLLDCQGILGNLQERHKTKLCVSLYERASQDKVSRYLYICESENQFRRYRPQRGRP